MTSVFLSYSHRDREVAARLASDLTNKAIRVWLDEWEILVGDSITQRVQQGLSQVDFVTLLLTAHSVGSGWVEKEWQSQIGLEAEKKQIRILPVKADSCEIPLLLRDKRYADISTDYDKGLSDLIRAIQGHADRQTAKLNQPSHPDRDFPARARSKRTHWRQYGYALAVIAALAVALLIYRSQTNRSKQLYEPDRNDATAIFAKRAGIVPATESYKIREVRQPPVPEYSNFELLEDRRVIDLRDWKPFERASKERVSPVTWSRRVLLRKIRETDQARFEFATEGAGIDAECVSGQDYYLEAGIISTSPPQVLMKAFQVVVNVAKYKLGEEFQIEFQATFWNGSSDQEDWAAYKVYAPVKVVSMLILFPEQKLFKWKKNVMYSPESPDERPPPEDQRSLIYTPDHRAVFWEIREPIRDNIYEIQWGW